VVGGDEFLRSLTWCLEPYCGAYRGPLGTLNA
jgi:hypothetical protein